MSTRPSHRRPTFSPLASLVALVAIGLAACGGVGGDTAQPAPAVSPPASAESEPSEPAPAVSSPSASTPDPGPGSLAEQPQLRPLPPAGGIPEAEVEEPQPVGLSIGQLSIENSTIRPVGVEPDGEFEVPIASEVGWYRFGSGPGESGSTVLAAHIAFDGEDGVFRRLATIEPGALVEVALDDGSAASYEIVERTVYDKTALPDDIFDESGPERLVLITCGGEFNPQLRSYESNVVAYAVPIG